MTKKSAIGKHSSFYQTVLLLRSSYLSNIQPVLPADKLELVKDWVFPALCKFWKRDSEKAQFWLQCSCRLEKDEWGQVYEAPLLLRAKL